MRIRKILIAALTFLGGLYFILEFIVPATVPFATTMGIAVADTPPTLTLRTADGNTIVQRMNADVALFVQQRDATGAFQPKQRKSRQIGEGDTITMRTRSITLGSFPSGGTPVDADGKPIALRPGEFPYPTGDAEMGWIARNYQQLLGRMTANGVAVISRMEKGETVNVEVRGATVTAIERGSVALLVGGRRSTKPLTANSLVMRCRRRSDPEEIEVFQVAVGDTLRIGPNTIFRDQRDTAAQFNAVIGTLALGMGLISLGLVNGRRLRNREKEWYTSLLFFGAISIGVLAGLGKYASPGSNGRAFSDIIVLQVINSMGSAIFSLLAFYLASAAYRAFRIRTAEAALMMATALIVMLGQTPFGMYMTGWMGERYQALWLPNIAGWILRVPSAAFVRALIFGAMLGAIATALRYWLSLERAAGMGDD